MYTSNGRVWSCIVKTKMTGPWKFVLEYPWGKDQASRTHIYDTSTDKTHSVVLCGFGQNGEVFSRRRSAYERKSELFLIPTCSSKFLISLFYFCCYLRAVTSKRQQKTHIGPNQATATVMHAGECCKSWMMDACRAIVSLGFKCEGLSNDPNTIYG